MTKTNPQIRSWIDRLLRFLRYRVLHVNDSPHRIALGIAIGLFIGWTPTMGLHMLLVLGPVFLLKANKIAAFTSVWISNPFTIIPIYYPSYLLGRLILHPLSPADTLSTSQINQLFETLHSGTILADFYHAAFWKNVFALLLEVGPELWVGSLITGSVAAAAGYFVTYHAVVHHRSKHPHRRFRKNV